jgi:pyruvate formate lyase activating enzyme
MMDQLTRRNFLGLCGRSLAFCASSSLFALCVATASTRAATLTKGFIGKKRSPYFKALGNRMIRCELCPHQCEVRAGERGFCQVRENIDGQYYSLVYANPCAIQIDPIEKKPFYHVLPSGRAFSLATAGCNLHCKFCQNWEISQARPEDTYNYSLPPDQAVSSALAYDCDVIASTYVEPVIFIEYMLDIGRLLKSQPLLNVMHSNGFVNPRPLEDLCDVLDAACIDLKGFTRDYYQTVAEGSLEPVLNALKILKTRKVHTEIVNLLVPGKNDDMEQVRAMCQWICKELGPTTPLHFSRFYPRYKLKGIPPTAVSTLERARDVALRQGLQYVYLGNVPDHPGGNTCCPHCRKVLIRRVGYQVKVLGLKDGSCQNCGLTIPGIWKIRQA